MAWALGPDRRQDKVKNAKLAIDFKLSQWLPLKERRLSGGAVSSQPQPQTSSREWLPQDFPAGYWCNAARLSKETYVSCPALAARSGLWFRSGSYQQPPREAQPAAIMDTGATCGSWRNVGHNVAFLLGTGGTFAPQPTLAVPVSRSPGPSRRPVGPPQAQRVRGIKELRRCLDVAKGLEKGGARPGSSHRRPPVK